MGDTVRFADNRRAGFNYTLERTITAGLVLAGWEVKAIRASHAQLQEAYVAVRNGELWLVGCHITPLGGYASGTMPDPVRARKLLVHKSERDRLLGKVEVQGYTLVPLNLHLAQSGAIKLDIALAKGKKQHDKRTAEREKESGREQQRAMKQAIGRKG